MSEEKETASSYGKGQGTRDGLAGSVWSQALFCGVWVPRVLVERGERKARTGKRG